MTRMKCFDGLNRGPWQPDEDRLLKAYIEANGVGRWSTLPTKAGLKRCGKSCRLRWMNYLRPDVKRGHISADEEDLIIRLHKLVGNRWSLIAARVPGRTDNDIKNFWNIHLSKKLGCKGIHLPPKSKAKNAASSNDNGRGDSTTGKMHSTSSADKNVERHNLNVQTDSIAGRAESKPLEHPCNLNPAFNTRSLCASTSTTVQVDQQNSDGIVSDSIQGLTSCDQYHADRMPDSFWFGSLPWLDSNGGDNFCCNYSTTFFNDAQPNSLISEFDMRDLW